ncbi:glycine betaine ABC transporter substrate-binding protein [Natribacillus halophilus]|uniref:Glycine betaine/proline transport system substrate-binding protein n=1 Tax=Natribacillus halophilus TaxID=549003 RepID=A0A1G8KUB0_9BACI|nr:glycine betaine ABC transporter substrate-binding protein [Natribacillus halophilus]SDI46510.1 glycine betaine/proline transport system substrate-binding protein [Natribacillus halophilus]
MKKYGKKGWMISGLIMAFIVAGCGEDAESGEEAEEDGSADYNEALGYNIVGIDAGSGTMAAAEDAINDYDLDHFDLQSSSDAAMVQELDSAIENEEPIVVVGWTPHWKFNTYDLKFLDDPQEAFGDTEDIHTIAYPGLEEEHPEAFEVIDNFYWDEDDMGEVMEMLEDGVEPEEAGRTWVDDNEDQVSEWTEGVEEVDGETIELGTGAWESEFAATAVVQAVLEDIGYDVNSTTMETAILWEAVADGEAHAHFTAWLPYTNDSQYEEFAEEDDVVDLGPNLEDARIGFVVPEYMDIDSIEDLQE